VGIVVIIAGSGIGVLLSYFTREDPRVVAVRKLEANLELWDALPGIALFSESTSGTIHASFAIPEFRTDTIAAGNQYVFLSMAGVPRSKREGQNMLCVIDPAARNAAVTVEPLPRLEGKTYTPSLQLLTVTSNFTPISGETAVFKLSQSLADKTAIFAVPVRVYQNTVPLKLFQGEEKTGKDISVALESVTAADIGPDGKAMIVALLNTSQNSAYLVETSLTDSHQESYVLSNQGSRISGVVYSPNGSRILYVREHGDSSQSLWLVPSKKYDGTSTKDLTRDGVQVAEGRFIVSRKPFSPDNRSITYAAATITGRSDLFLTAIDAVGTPLELGQGYSPCWHNRGNYIVALAEDRGQESQLFAIETKPPYRRKQLSFVSGGLQNHCDITADGRWAVAVLQDPNSNSVVLIDLSKVQFY